MVTGTEKLTKAELEELIKYIISTIDTKQAFAIFINRLTDEEIKNVQLPVTMIGGMLWKDFPGVTEVRL